MKNHQQLHYHHYYRMLTSGETVECTRQECFAPTETPTADNLFIQRWYYSPDRELAVRLPRNAMGEATHKANAADLKDRERSQKRPNLCLAQTSAASCSVTCENCRNKDYCDSKSGTHNGADCKLKCDYCASYMRRTLDLDKPLGFNDDGTAVMFGVEDERQDVESEYAMNECRVAIRIAVDALSPDERHLWNDLLNEKAKAKIAEECGLSEGAIRKRVKKLAATLRENPGLKNYF